MRFRAVLFDFDGVLAASELLHHRCYNAVLAEAGQELDEAEFRTRYVHYDDYSLFRAFAEHRNLAWTEEKIRESAERSRELFLQELGTRDILYPGMGELARRLAARMPLAVVSMGDRRMIEQSLANAGIADCFGAIVAAGEAPQPKPHPDPYLLGLARLQESTGAKIPAADCAVVEDSAGGVRSGVAAGMIVLALTHNQTEASLKGAGAKWVLNSTNALRQLLVHAQK